VRGDPIVAVQSDPPGLAGTLLMGLMRREKSGIANIGFESVTILLLCGGAAAFMLST
jgi:hypothetical protein